MDDYSSQGQQYPQQYSETYTPQDVYASQSQEVRIKNIIEQISPDLKVHEFIMRLKGYYKDSMSEEWVKISKEAPEPSPLLVSRYVSFLSSFSSQNNSLSNYSALQINQIMGGIIEWVVDDLASNAAKYGLENDFTERTRIAKMIFQECFAVLSRARDGIEAKRMWGALKLTESFNLSPQKQGGIASALKFWK